MSCRRNMNLILSAECHHNPNSIGYFIPYKESIWIVCDDTTTMADVYVDASTQSFEGPTKQHAYRVTVVTQFGLPLNCVHVPSP